jgi:hypothetical protein
MTRGPRQASPLGARLSANSQRTSKAQPRSASLAAVPAGRGMVAIVLPGVVSCQGELASPVASRTDAPEN